MTSVFIRDVIQDCYSKVESKFYSGELLSELYSRKCISEEEKQQIDLCGTPYDKGRKMLDVLAGKPDHILDIIVEFFHTHEPQHHLESIIRESGLKFEYSFNTECAGGFHFTARRAQQRFLSETWWPARKEPIKFLVERRLKEDDTLIVHHLRKLLVTRGLNSSAVFSNTVAIVGMAGVGKTTIVKSYAREYQGEYDHIIWIGSEGTALYTSFKRLGRKLGLLQNQADDADFHLSHFDELLHDIYGKLKNAQCLFVFDNAERFIGQHGLKAALPKNGLHHTLITSRNHDWGNPVFGHIQKLQLNVFSEAECILLLSLTLDADGGKGGTKYEMVALGEQLGFLPLALQCAMFTILETRKYTLKSYLQHLQKDMTIVMNRKIVSEYERTLGETFQYSISQLIGMNDEGIDSNVRDWCITILNVFAYCEPDSIQEAFLVEVWKENAHEISEALNILLSYSLVYANAEGGPNIEGRRFLGGMHPLMQEMIRRDGGVFKNRERLINELTSVLNTISRAVDRRVYRRHEVCVWKLASEQFQEILLTCHDIPHCWYDEEKSFYKSTLAKLRLLLAELDLRVVQLKFKLMDPFIHGGNYIAHAHETRILYNRLKEELMTADRKKIPYVLELLLHLRTIDLEISSDVVRMTMEDGVAVSFQQCPTACENVLRELFHVSHDGVINGMRMYSPAAQLIPELGLRGSLMLSHAVIQGKFDQFECSNSELELIFAQCASSWPRLCAVYRHLMKCPKRLDAIIPNLFKLIKTATAEGRMETTDEHLPQVVEFVQMYVSWLVKEERKESASKYLHTLLFLNTIDWVHSNNKMVKLLLRVLNWLSLSLIPDQEQDWKGVKTTVSCTLEKFMNWVQIQREQSEVVGIHFMLKINSIYSYVLIQIGINLISHLTDLDFWDSSTMVVLTNPNIQWDKIFQPFLEEFILATLNLVSKISSVVSDALPRSSESKWELVLENKVKILQLIIAKVSTLCTVRAWSIESLIDTYDGACCALLLLERFEDAGALWVDSIEFFKGCPLDMDVALVSRIGKLTLQRLEKTGQWGTWGLFVQMIAGCLKPVWLRQNFLGKVKTNKENIDMLIRRLLCTKHEKIINELVSVFCKLDVPELRSMLLSTSP